MRAAATRAASLGSVPEWSAEVAVDAALVGRLVAGQFPEVALRSVGLLAEGWDNTVWLVDETWVFRLPRRAVAIAGVEREIAVLPRLAPFLPLPIPEPVFVGHPAEGFPWPFFGCRFLPGREVPDAGLTEADRRGLARPLGAFLRRLHRHDLAGRFDELPADPNRRGDMRLRVPMTWERLREVERLGLWRRPSALRWLDAARELPDADASSIVHGDLHARHLLVDEHDALAAVIDWGDVCRADPAIDLPLLWSGLPPDARGELLSAYGPVGEEPLLRARVLALFLGAALALYAHHERLIDLERDAIRGLDRACRE